MVDINSLNREDLEALLDLAKSKRDHYIALVKRIEASIGSNGSVNLRAARVTVQFDHPNTDVIYSLLKREGRWMGNATIREILEKDSGREVDRRELTGILKEGEKNHRFQRRGIARNTEWKAV
jgi:hypothetical protein